MSRSWSRRAAVALVGVGVLVVAGCGSSDDVEGDVVKDATPCVAVVERSASEKPPEVTKQSSAPKKLVVKDLDVDEKGCPAESGKYLSVDYVGVVGKTGKQFDSSWSDEPLDVQLGAGQVIQGWEQGLDGMKVGGQRQLDIPADLAYGKEGKPPDIPGNAALRFVVNLRGVYDTPKCKDAELIPAKGQPSEVDMPDRGPEQLDIKELKEGKGKAAASGNYVVANILAVACSSGQEVLSTWQSGQEPAKVTLGSGQTLAAIDQGLTGMKVGGRRQLNVPARMAVSGQGQGIAGQDEPVVMVVEVTKLQDKPPPTTTTTTTAPETTTTAKSSGTTTAPKTTTTK
jgi:peptidylprolyl isomerase